MHYNDGWDNGYHYNITYWEIWNEPDLVDFWTGTAEDYYELYRITALTLKNYNSSLKIGAPATSSIYHLDASLGFLEYIVENNLPLDFYSWHLYYPNPYNFYYDSCLVDRTLEEYGLNNTENILSEWNIGIDGLDADAHGGAKGAAFTACVLIFLQDSGCDRAFRYRGTQGHNGLTGLGLFEADGGYKKTAYVYKAMKMLLETPIRLYTNKMNYNESFAFIAGISEDKQNITILISNYESRYTEYNLTIENLPWSNFTYTRYVLNDTFVDIAEIENLNSSSIFIYRNMSPNSVQLIRLTSQEPPKIEITKPREGHIYILDREITSISLKKQYHRHWRDHNRN